MNHKPVLHTFKDDRGKERKEYVLSRDGALEPPTVDPRFLRMLDDVGERIAIIRDGHLGDIIMMTPALREFHSQYPAIQANVFTDASYTRVLEHNSNIEGVYPLSEYERKDFIFTIDLRRYVENHEHTWEKDRISLFGEGLGVQVQDGKTEFVVTEDDREEAQRTLSGIEQIQEFGQFAVIAPDASDTRRELSDECVWELEELFPRADYATYVTGSRRGYLPSLGALAGILELADYIITVDNGVCHLAAALKRPCLSVFTTIPPVLRVFWYPYCDPLVADVECAPCCEDEAPGCKHECKSSITAKQIWGVMPKTSGELRLFSE